jgi:hypothetical protein
MTGFSHSGRRRTARTPWTAMDQIVRGGWRDGDGDLPMGFRAARRVARVGLWVAQSEAEDWGSRETVEWRVVWMFLKGSGLVGRASRRMDGRR